MRKAKDQTLLYKQEMQGDPVIVSTVMKVYRSVIIVKNRS